MKLAMAREVVSVLQKAVQDNNLPMVKQLQEDDLDLPSQANVRAENAGIFRL